MNYFLSKIAKLNIDVLSELALVLPPTFLFPVVDERLLAVGGVYVFERMLSPTSKYRWRIVNHHTTVHHLNDGNRNRKRRVWCLNGLVHRENDQPARVWESGTKEWWFHGKWHREHDKPAVVESNGYKAWYQNGKRHRDGDQPAIINANGDKFWCLNGQLHRENDKPARVYSNGDKEWWFNGKRHRGDGNPASVYTDGHKAWWVNGKRQTGFSVLDLIQVVVGKWREIIGN